METLGLGMVLNYGGLLLGIVSIIIWGILAGFVGFFLSRSVKGSDEKGKRYLTFCFALFLACWWAYLIGWSSSYDSSLFGGVVIAALATAMCAVIADSVLCGSIFTDTPLWKKHKHEGKFLFVILMGVLFAILLMVCFWQEVVLIKYSKSQRIDWTASYYILDKNSDSGDIEYGLAMTNRYKQATSPHYLAIANLRLGNYGKASEYFREHASVQSKKKESMFWMGIERYYSKDFNSAAGFFNQAGEYELELVSLSRNNTLTAKAFDGLFAKIQPEKLPDDLVNGMRLAISERRRMSVEKEGNGCDDILKCLKSLSYQVSELKESLNKEKQETVTAGSQMYKQKIDAYVFSTLLERSLGFSKNHVADENDVALLLIFAWPVFLSIMYGTNMALRDYLITRPKTSDGNKYMERIKKRLSAIIARWSWHSSIARKISARIALMEKEKGVFSKEVAEIHQAVFPVDIILAVLCLVKIKKIFRTRKVQSLEEEDVKSIYHEVKILSGKLIPQGDESALSVITALRKKAIDIINQHLKSEISYMEARSGLLETLFDLATIGDILEARKGENQISFYALLGIKKQAKRDEVKAAYRNIVAVIHPDINQGNQYLESLTALVNNAYAILNNQARREAYNVRMDF